MKRDALNSQRSILALAIAAFAAVTPLSAQDASFNGAPASAAAQAYPHSADGDPKAGQEIYQQRCAACHGMDAKGAGNVPALTTPHVQSAKPGELFWYITKGDLANGMPSWAALPEQQRWQVVSYVKYISASNGKPLAPVAGAGAGATAAASPASSAKFDAPAPTPPFTDFRYEEPGKVRKVTVADLPEALRHRIRR